jgi:hypothetical protein
MTPRNSGGRPASRPTTNHINPDQRTASARAQAVPPCAGRGLWLVIVLTCPGCGSGHAHRVGDVAMLLAGKVFKRCRVTGERYRLGPVQRRREARRG